MRPMGYLLHLLFSSQEKMGILMVYIAPIPHLTAKGAPTTLVESHLQLVENTALGTNSWNIAEHMLSLAPKMGGGGLSPLGSYANWAYTHTFTTVVLSQGMEVGSNLHILGHRCRVAFACFRV